MLRVESRDRPDAVGAQELVLVEHLGEDSPQPLRGDEGHDSAVGHPEVTGAGGVDGLEELRHLARACLVGGRCDRNALPLPRLGHRRGAQGQQPHQ